MISLTPIELAVLARIGRSPDGPLLRQLLDRMLKDADQDCRTKEGAAVHRAQGAAQTLEKLHSYLDGAAQASLEDATRNRTRVTRPISTSPWSDQSPEPSMIRAT